MKGPKHSHNAYYLLGVVTGAGGVIACVALNFAVIKLKGFIAWVILAVVIAIIAKVHYELDD